MWKCPVCKEQHINDCDQLCQNCGFDKSRDFEHYPTLTLLTEKLYAVSAQSKIQEERQNDLLHCPQCKGQLFLFHRKESTFRCANCGAVIRDVVFSEDPGAPIMLSSQEIQVKRIGLECQKQNMKNQTPELSSENITPQSSNSVESWRRSEAAHRQWLKSLEAQQNDADDYSLHMDAEMRRLQQAHQHWANLQKEI